MGMDLKSRLTEAGVAGMEVHQILGGVSFTEAEQLISMDDASFVSIIPELTKKYNIPDKLKLPEEIDVSNMKLNCPGQEKPHLSTQSISLGPSTKSDTVKSVANPPPLSVSPELDVSANIQLEDKLVKLEFPPPPENIPNLYADNKLKRKSKAFTYLSIFAIVVLTFYLISKFQKKEEIVVDLEQNVEDVETIPVPPEIKKDIPKKTEDKLFNTPDKLIAVMPAIPSFRGGWMFMPWDNYIPEAICNDGRFDNLGSSFTVEFWFKRELDILGEVNLFEFINGSGPIERLFLNEEGELSFTAGNGLQVYKYNNPFPTSKAHYHIALIRNKSTYRIFINGSKKIEFEIKEATQQKRTAIRLFRSDNALKGLAIDELRISNTNLYEKKFTPERILNLLSSSVLYVPFEKGDSIHCYGEEHYSNFKAIGGKWQSIISEIQEVMNHLEFLDK
jgi:hypothetical protein